MERLFVSSGHRSLRRAAVGLAAAAAMAAPLLIAAQPAAAAPNQSPQKVWVCKYVNTPGVNEVLKSGKNPIAVSVNSIGEPVGIGSEFADAQYRSVVIDFQTSANTGHGNSYIDGIEACPSGIISN